jgi:hypothetical protein
MFEGRCRFLGLSPKPQACHAAFFPPRYFSSWVIDDRGRRSRQGPAPYVTIIGR